mgnify:FL=1
MGRNHETTTKFNVDISDLKKGIQDAQRQIRLANAEFKASSSALDDWSKSADGISAKLKQLDSTLTAQEKILDNLEEQYKQVVEAQGEGSKGAEELKIKIENQKASINKTKKDIEKYNQSLNDIAKESEDAGKECEDAAGDVQEVGDAGKNAAKGLTQVDDASDKAANGLKDVGSEAKETSDNAGGLKDKLAGLAKNGLAAVATAAAGLVTAFVGSAEATREFRVALGKVDTAFTTAGYSAETGKKTFEDFAAILGDTDQATEAVGNLAKLATSEQDLAKWTKIATGVYGQFGDGLPIEGLTEAANETAKVAQVTGPLADALNWATTDTEAWNKALGGNKTALAAFQRGVAAGENAEDSFNLALQACNSEQERSQLITATLTSLYGDAADAYTKTNSAIMDANRAQTELNEAMAGVGAVAEPVMTSFKMFGASLLTDLLPGVEELGGAFTNLIHGMEGADAAIGTAISDVLITVVNKITEMLPRIATVGLSLVSSLIQGIVSALPSLVTTAIEIINTLMIGLSEQLPVVIQTIVEIIPQIIDAIISMLPEFINAAITLVQALVDALPTIMQALINALPDVIQSIIEGLVAGYDALSNGALQFFMSIVNALPQIIDSLIAALPQILNAIIQGLLTAMPQLLQACITFWMAIIQAIPTIVTALVDALPQIITTIINTLLDNIPLLLDTSIQLFMQLVKAIPQIIVSLAKAVPKIVVSIMAALVKILPRIAALGAQILGRVLAWFTNMIQTAKEKGGEFVSGLINSIKELPGKMWEKLKDAASKVVDFGKDLKNKAKEAGTKLVDGVKENIKSLPDDIVETGKNIVLGLWNGINDKFDWLTDKIKSFASNVTDKIKGFFGIHSPSRVMRDQVGKYLAEGLAVGIDRHKDEVYKAFDDIKRYVSKPIDLQVNSAKVKVAASSQSAAGMTGGSTNNNTSYTFNQYNNSPKALSRLEIYRQTKNQLNFAKGV